MSWLCGHINGTLIEDLRGIRGMQLLLRRLVVLLGCCLLAFGSAYRLEAASSGTGGADLSPIEYSILKNFSAEFCEAVEDGVSVPSAYEVAMQAALWKSAGSIVGYVLGSIGQESDQAEADAPSTADDQFQEMVLKKTHKCLTAAQSEELRMVLTEQWNPQETG